MLFPKNECLRLQKTGNLLKIRSLFPERCLKLPYAIRVQFSKKTVENMEKCVFLGFKVGKIKYKTQNLDSLDTPFYACGSRCCAQRV
jgi:hypothetical protein